MSIGLRLTAILAGLMVVSLVGGTVLVNLPSWSLAVAIMLAVMIAYIVSRYFFAPLRRVTQAIYEISQAEGRKALEGITLVAKGRDEIGFLANSASRIAARLIEATKLEVDIAAGAARLEMLAPLERQGVDASLPFGHSEGQGWEAFGYLRPACFMPGDIWTFRPLGDGNSLGFLLCDVAGKGPAAAMILAQIATLVTDHFDRWDQTSKSPGFGLGELMARINSYLIAREYLGMFAALVVGVLSTKTGVVHLCPAGLSTFEVLRASTGNTIKVPYNSKGAATPAVGAIHSDMRSSGLDRGVFPVFAKRIEKGDMLFFGSDGPESAKWRARDTQGAIVERDEHPVEEELGEERLLAIMEAYDRRCTLEVLHGGENSYPLFFDFSNACADLSERVIAPVAIARAFAITDWNADPGSFIIVDQCVDSFLKRNLTNYDLLTRGKEMVDDGNWVAGPNSDTRRGMDANRSKFLRYQGISEEPQFDDFAQLGIRLK